MKMIVLLGALAAAAFAEATPQAGLLQYRLTFSGDVYMTPDNWATYWNKADPVVMPGALMAKSTSMNGTTWQGVTYPFGNRSGYWYEGYIKLEAGKTYSAKSAFDDGGCVYIDGQMVYQQGTSSGYNGTAPSVTPVPFVCTKSGWHKLQLGMWDWGGGRGVFAGTFAIVQWSDGDPTEVVKDYSDKTNWHEFWDVADDGVTPKGSYLYTEDPGVFINVQGAPENFGTPSPDYGLFSTLTPGSEYTFTCPEVYTNDAQTIAARNTGWRLTKADGTSTEGLGNEKSIVYGDDYACSTLTWLWEKKVKMTATASGNGTDTMSNGDWFAVGETVTLTAVADEENRFTGWTGDGVPAGKANSNPLTFTANAPLALTANFAVDPTFYVSVDGDDNDDGSKTTPFATVSNALAKANAAIGGGATHSTIKIGTGLFDLQQTISLTNAITVTGEGIGKTVLKPDASLAALRMLRLNHDSAVVENLSVTNAFCNYGRGAGAYVSAGTVRRCEFYNCHIGGGGTTDWNKGHCVVLSGSNAKAVACVIRGLDLNDGCGEALYLEGGAVAESCHVCDNSVSGRSTSYMVYVDNGTVRGCTIANNYMGNSTAVGLGNNGYLKDCIVYGNRGSSKTTGSIGNGFDIVGSASRVINTLTTDPGFRDFANKNYALGPGPAIDAAKYGADTLALTGVDAAGNARQSGAGVDIGALECQQDAGVECAFVADKTTALEGEVVTFNLYSIGAGASPTYTIDFGDGSATEEVTGSSVTHSYAKGGKYKVTLSVPGATPFEKANAVSVKAKNLYVAVGGTGVAPFTEDDPAGYIEDALAEAADGCTIWLADGNYTFKADQRISVKKGVRIVGKSGDRDKVVISPHTKDKHMMFLLDHSNAGLYNLTVQGGYNGSQTDDHGCNVKIDGSGGTVSNCVVRNGKATNGYSGSVAGIRMAAGLVTHSVISNNTAHCYNYGKDAATAVSVRGGRLENCLVTGNTGSGSHGAPVQVSGASAKVVNCTIAGNTAVGNAGVLLYGVTSVAVINTLICDNKSTGETGDMSGICVAYKNGDNGQGWTADKCMTACAAPALINESCYTALDLKLAAGYVPLAGSVCRDNGVTSGLSVPEKDLAGNPRIDEDSGKIDIGCYEFTSAGLSVSITADPVAAKGVTPYKMTFAAEVEGGTPTGYRWFEDGVELVGETAATLERTYETAGNYVVALKVSDGTGEYDAANTIPVTVYPAKLTVDADHSLADAYAAAGDGTLIEVVPGTYQINTLGVVKGVTIRGVGATPADVTFRPKSSGQKLFTLNHVSVRLENLTIAGGYRNQQADPGVGVYIYGQGGVVSNCVIASCTNDGDATGGGGVYLGSAGAVVTHCVITNCTCSRSRALGNSHCGGAGVLLDNGLLAETLIADCRSGEGTSESDGALSIYGGKAVNCTIAGCRSGGCAGVRVHGGSVINTVISGNTTGSTNPTNAVYAGEASVFDTCLSDGEEPINGTCLVEPAERTFKDLARGKFVIKGSSVGRDAGKARADAPSVDLKGRPRLFGKAIDLGCYESQAGGLSVIVR